MKGDRNNRIEARALPRGFPLPREDAGEVKGHILPIIVFKRMYKLPNMGVVVKAEGDDPIQMGEVWRRPKQRILLLLA